MQRITGELADLAQTAMREAAAVIRNGKRACARASGQRQGQLRRALADLDTILERAARVITQTRSRLDGVMPESATRLVSLHDPDARPIRKGRLGIPVEFGLRLEPHRTHRHRRRPNLVRTRSLRPQPGQDRSPHPVTTQSRHRPVTTTDRPHSRSPHHHTRPYNDEPLFRAK